MASYDPSELAAAFEELKKAAERLRRCHEAQQKAANEHQEALRRVEDIIEVSVKTLQDEHAHIEVQRDQLDGWRQELDSQQTALAEDGSLKDLAQEDLPLEEEMLEAPLDDVAQPEDFGAAPVDSERAPREDYKSGWLLGGKGGKDRGRASSGKGSHAAAPPQGRRERSRSRDGARRGSSSTTLDVVKEKMETLGLDDRCADQVLSFPPDEALRMLGQVNDSIRNPSSFIMSLIKRKQQEETQPPPQPGPQDRLKDRIAAIGLDNSCERTLGDLPIHEALRIVDQVDENVRNPSAFVMSKAHAIMKGAGKGRHGPSQAERLEIRVHELGLDGSAKRMLDELTPEQALDIVDQVREDTRNPSAFVMAEVRKFRDGLHADARPIHRVPPRGSSSGPVGGGGPVGGDGGHRGGHGGTRIEKQVHDLAANLSLDRDCISSLESIGVEDAIAILDRLARAMPNVRNRSAFVHAEVKKVKQSYGEQPRGYDSHRDREQHRDRDTPIPRAGPPPGGGGGHLKHVPCKFFAEGRCRNGNDCKFSHDPVPPQR